MALMRLRTLLVMLACVVLVAGVPVSAKHRLLLHASSTSNTTQSNSTNSTNSTSAGANATATTFVTGSLHIYAVIPSTSSTAPDEHATPRMDYVLHADDGRTLSLDMTQVPGMGIGPDSATRCLPFTISSSDNTTGQQRTGLSCESDADPVLRQQLRQPGVRISVGIQQSLSATRAQGASAARSASIPATSRVTATSLQVLTSTPSDTAANTDSDASASPSSDAAAAAANSTRRQLSVTTGSINLLYVVTTACGRPATLNPSDIRNTVYPLYRSWFQSVSYGRASLDPRSDVQVVDVPCSMASTCLANYGTEFAIASAVRSSTNFRGRGFTNVIIVMPPAFEAACNVGYEGLGVVGGSADVTWVKNANAALNEVNVALHELLHNFGLAHANSADNTEYRDTTCIMSNFFPGGRTVLYPNAPHMWQLGWADLVADVDMGSLSSARSFQLTASSRNRADNVLRLRGSTMYYLQLRSRTSPLDNLPAQYDQNVVMQRFAGDQNTANPTNFVGSLRSGESMTIEGVTISVTSVGGGSASVTVSRGGSAPPSGNGACAWFDNSGARVTPTGDTSTCAKCQAACAPHPQCYTYTWNGGNRANYNDASVCNSTPQLSCPDIAGYTKYVGQDHTGDDINNACITGTDFNTAAAACNSNPSCRAFNMLAGRGFYCVKSAASPLTPLADACFYTKNAPPGNGACAWFDNNGASVTPAGDTSTCAKCQAACAPHPQCYSYAWNGGNRANYNDASVCSSTPQLSCPDIAGYTKYVGQDHTGDDINNACITGTDFNTAAAACNSNPSCRAFNMLAGRGFYCVKSAASPLTPLADACFYTKNAPPGNGACAWFDNSGARVTPTGDTSTCAKCQAACAPHPQCYTYTWNGGNRANYNDASVCSSGGYGG